MKRWLKLFGYVVIISQLFSINIPILSTLVAGYSVKYILYYLFILIVNIIWFSKKFLKKRVNIKAFIVGIMIISPFLIGVIMGWSLGNIIIEAVLFIMPVTVYQWVDLVDIDSHEIVCVFSWVSIVAGIISILVAFRIIQTDIWAAQGDFVRAAGAIDSTLGIGGVALALILLYVYPENYKGKMRFFLIGMLISSVVILIFSQSRTRIVLMLVIVLGVIIYNFFNGRSKLGTLKLILMIALGIIVATSLFPQVFNQIMEQVATRFNSVGATDVNIVARSNESALQLKAFLSSPILGLGWGCRVQYSDMYVHNIYTSLLMYGGLLFGTMYIIWLLSFLFRAMSQVVRRQNLQWSVISVCMMVLLIVLGFANGGIVQSGGYFMAIIPFMVEKKWKEDRVVRF